MKPGFLSKNHPFTRGIFLALVIIMLFSFCFGGEPAVTSSLPSGTSDAAPPDDSGTAPGTEDFTVISSEITTPESDDPGTSEAPGTAPETEPVTAQETAPETSPETSPETLPETQPETEPVTHPVTQPVTEPVTQPITEPVTQPITQPETEPQTTPVTEPETEPAFAGYAPLSGFSILFDGTSPFALSGAHEVAEAILACCGKTLSLLPGSGPAGSGYITIGIDSYPEGRDDGWLVLASGGSLSVTASDEANLKKACSSLAAKIAADSAGFASLSDGWSLFGSAGNLFASAAQSRVERTAGTDIRVMSFNILHENYNDRLPVSGRDSKVASVLLTYRPDAVGLQEVSEAWHDTLEAMVGEIYSFIPDLISGSGRSYSTIMYDRTKAELLEYGTTVYSKGNNALLRNLTWARLRRLSDGSEYIVTSTHWDINTNAAARVVQARENGELNSAMIAQYGLPIFSCGDYNRNEDTEEFTGFIAATGMRDSKLTAISSAQFDRAGKSTHTVGSALSGSTTGTVCIDHIVCTQDVEILYYTTVVDREALEASDHCPIFVDAHIGATKTSTDIAAEPILSSAVFSSGETLPFDGKGTKADPYIISCAANLRYLRDAVNAGNSFGGKYFRQTADVDLGGEEWTPIGLQGHPFSGNYDGGGYRVQGLRITVGREQNGLFGIITSYKGNLCTVANLTVEGEINLSSLSTAADRAGGLCGTAGLTVQAAGKTTLAGVISCVNITINASSGEPRVGGIAGYAGNAQIENCENSGNISINLEKAARTGGIAGQTSGVTIARCRNSGKINVRSQAATYVGGVTGIYSYLDFYSSSISLCVNSGEIISRSSSNASYAAGILGQGYSSGSDVNLAITKCVNRGKITAVTESGSKLSYAGGIVAYCSKKNFTVDGCVNTNPDVSGTAPSGTRSGGIFGVFNLPSAESSIVCRNCMTVGPLYGYNKNKLENNREKVTQTEAENAALEALK